MAYVTEKRGVFYAVIYEGRNPVSGRERRRWHRCDNHAAAAKVANDLTDRRARQRQTGSSLTLAEYLLGQWLPAKEATLAPSTHARYVSSAEHYLVPHLGDTPLRRLRTEHFETLYRRLLIAGSRTCGPLAAKTVTNLHQIIRSSLNDAVERGLLPSNPAATAHAPDHRKRPSARRRARSWTAAELGSFLTGTATNRHSMLFRLAAATGMRRGEILGLRWDDVHFDTGRIEVTQPSPRSATASSSPGSRPAPAAATSPSTPPPWTYSPDGDETRALSSKPAARSTSTASCSFVRTASRCTPTACPRRSNGPSGPSRCRRSGSTTCATPTPASCCETGSRSRSSPNGSGIPTRRSR